LGSLVAVITDGDAGPLDILLGVAAIGRAGQRLALERHRTVGRLAGESGGGDERPGILLRRGPGRRIALVGESTGERREVDARRRELGGERQYGGGVAQPAAIVGPVAVAVLAGAEPFDRRREGGGRTGPVAVEGERSTELGLGERAGKVVEARLDIVAQVA